MKAGSVFRPSRILFLAVMLIIGLFLIWPGYAFFSSAEPFILGFPLSFAWIIICTVAGFVAMLALYMHDNRNEQ